MDIKKLKYLFYITRIPNLGNIRIKTLLNSFPDAEEIFNLPKSKICRIDGFDNILAEVILSADTRFEEYDEEFKVLMEKCEKKGIKIVTISDEEYPENLKKIYDSPIFLYYKGNLSERDRYSIGIVGTRLPSEYGRASCITIAKELSESGIPIISGMAKGIDSVAHKTALTSGNLTYAILGCGTDVVYPPENKKLYEEIIEKGAVISEYEPGTKPDKGNFPKRNRIVSGISLGCIIVESGNKGGSLITASFALDQNREVFAIPGQINSRRSEGTNNLIKRGQAKLIMNAEDILNEFEYQMSGILKRETEKTPQEVSDLNLFEKKIFDILEEEPMHIDTISEKSGLSISDCLVNLLTMEFKNRIKQLPGKRFTKLWK